MSDTRLKARRFPRVGIRGFRGVCVLGGRWGFYVGLNGGFSFKRFS